MHVRRIGNPGRLQREREEIGRERDLLPELGRVIAIAQPGDAEGGDGGQYRTDNTQEEYTEEQVAGAESLTRHVRTPALCAGKRTDQAIGEPEVDQRKPN